MTFFKSKAETLLSLNGLLTTASVPPLTVVSAKEWREGRANAIIRVQTHLADRTVVVRSSAQGEDSHEWSHAGQYESILNIASSDSAALSQAIDTVFGSYEELSDTQQIFVQEQVTDVAMSGVLFTRDIDTSAPYFIYNYDSHTGSSSTVTSGKGTNLTTFIRARCAETPFPDERFALIDAMARELERLSGNDALDIEFAVDRENKLSLLQVRPLTIKKTPQTLDDAAFATNLLRISKKISKRNGTHPGLHGTHAIFSVMTDWNPAEIIGIRPRALSLSLYKELIMDSIWAYQRFNYGYRDLRSFPLLISFLGLPYIDVRASLNSFIPRGLDDELSGKLVDYYSQRLAETPTDHDKVEFNIVFSCYYLNVAEKLKKLLPFGFTELELDRIKFALLNLTNTILDAKEGLYLKDLERIEELKEKHEEILTSSLSTIDKIYWLIEYCKRYGTLPFAGLARAGFIAVQYLHSFVALGIITKDECAHYMGSLETVTRSFAHEVDAFSRGEIVREELLKRYGHLRPGTYDILSLRYDEAPEMYFKESRAAQNTTTHHTFCFSDHQLKKITEAMRVNGITGNAATLLRFIKSGIEAREYSKFIFTKTLSEVLKLVEQLGSHHGISREDLSYLDIKTVLGLYSSLSDRDVQDIFIEDIARGKKAHAVAQSIKLPQLIVNQDDIYSFFMGNVEANYITLGKTVEVIVTEEQFPHVDLGGKIALIRSADPGYDWIFSRGIRGLITMYGGANSHMAIRCAELGIPAVIGAGEESFSLWSQASMLEIDCALRKVRTIS